jgi:hypothetical protein
MLKESQSTYTKIINDNQLTIDNLKRELEQKCYLIDRTERRLKEASLEKTSMDNIYVKKYKELYEKGE